MTIESRLSFAITKRRAYTMNRIYHQPWRVDYKSYPFFYRVCSINSAIFYQQSRLYYQICYRCGIVMLSQHRARLIYAVILYEPIYKLRLNTLIPVKQCDLPMLLVGKFRLKYFHPAASTSKAVRIRRWHQSRGSKSPSEQSIHE